MQVFCLRAKPGTVLHATSAAGQSLVLERDAAGYWRLGVERPVTVMHRVWGSANGKLAIKRNDGEIILVTLSSLEGPL